MSKTVRLQSPISTKRILSILFILVLSFFVGPNAAAQSVEGRWGKIRSIYAADFDLASPRGMAFSPDANAFLLWDPNNDVTGISLREDPVDMAGLNIPVEEALNLAFDNSSNSLFVLNTGSSELEMIAANSAGRPIPAAGATSRFDMTAIDLQDAKGIAFDPENGRIFVLNTKGTQIVVITPDSASGYDGEAANQGGRVRKINLNNLNLGELRGLAFNPQDGHLFSFQPVDQTLYEFTEKGELVSTYDLSSLGLSNPQTLLFAPSGDSTDDPTNMNLFILDSGKTFVSQTQPVEADLAISGSLEDAVSQPTQTMSTGGQIVELALNEPLVVLPAALVTTTLVQTIDVSNNAWGNPPNPSSPDPAGVAYWPDHDTLLISDSEVDENNKSTGGPPPWFVGFNIFESSLTGTYLDACDTIAYSNEPTGITINPLNNHIFISDDNSGGHIFEIDLGTDSIYCTLDDIVTTLDLPDVVGGPVDAEGVAVGDNKVFIAAGIDREVYMFDLGADGVIGGGDDGSIVSFDTNAAAIRDPEGIEYNPEAGTLFIASTYGSDDVLFEVSLTGTVVNTYDVSYLDTLYGATTGGRVPRSGLAYGPSSENPAIKNLYLSSRMVDNGSGDPVQALENDGLIWEINIGNTPAGQTVTFNANGGTGTMSPQVASVPTALTLNTFTRTGYTFAGWNTASNGSGTSYADGATYDFTADITLYAQWTPLPNHTVTFNNNGGTGTMSPQVANVPTALTLNTFTRTGYNFAGWNTASNGSGTAYANGATYDFSADVTLYAQWTALADHTVTFNNNGGTGTMSPQVASVPTALTLNTFTRTGYTFANWNTASDGSGTAYADGATYDFSADVTLYAQWTALPNHTVTFNANGGTGTMSPQVANVPTALTLNAFTRTGYTFANWNTASDGSGTAYADGATYDFSADITLYAQWTPLPNHTVTFNANGGTGTMSPQVANVPTALTLNTFTRTGYNFAGWNTASNGSGTAYANGATYDFSADVTLYAQWTALPNHTVTFNANGGTGTMSPQVANVPTALTLNAFTRTGYTFANWNTASDGSGTAYADGATYDFSADITLYAQWTVVLPDHTVTFDANGGTGTMTPQVANVPTALTLNSFTRTGYEFAGWNTVSDGNGAAYADGATYDFLADLTLYAQWAVIKYVPSGDIPVDGTISGSYLDTHANDNLSEAITELVKTGKPSTRHSYLEHIWTFSLPSIGEATFYANAWMPSSGDGDKIEFAFSTDGSNFTKMFTLSATSDGPGYESYSLPLGISGVVYVRATDTDRNGGNLALDTLYVDHLFILVDTPPTTLPNAPGELAATATSSNQIDLEWKDNSDNESGFEIERSLDGNTWDQITTVSSNVVVFSDDGLDADTIYYYRVRATNQVGESEYSNIDNAKTTQLSTIQIHVGDLDSTKSIEKNKWFATVSITVHDQDHIPVQGATVTGNWNEDATTAVSCVTDANGICSITLGRISTRDTNVTFTVTDVMNGSDTYMPAYNHDDENDDSDGTTITISAP